VIAAIVYWNSTYFADAVGLLRSKGELILNELLAHTSPVKWNQITFSGDFLWDRAAAAAVEGRRPLNARKNAQAICRDFSRWKNSAWLIVAVTVSGRNGLVIR
jgi:hypothetical protein